VLFPKADGPSSASHKTKQNKKKGNWSLFSIV
jgi:hypothetical protein